MLPESVRQPRESKALKSSLHWECRPRYVREYVWNEDEPLNLSTALTSVNAAPVPKPPPNEIHNKVAWRTIRDYSHLFQITTPVKVECLHALSVTHPNRPFVNSICEGLVDGFWPWAVTYASDTPAIVDNATLQRIKDLVDLAFMQEQRDEEIALGRFSEVFPSLLLGMTTIPLWVVPKPHSDKLRLVVDHSTGNYSPNLYISSADAKVHLDTLRALGAALLRARKEHGDRKLTLFKMDVLQAYQRLPVHPLWQLRQVIMIDNLHHVDNNNNFGDRGAGRLWITFFSLVLWIAIFVKFILDLFAYIDDAFSWDFADSSTFYAPYCKCLPLKQAAIIRCGQQMPKKK
ncbi:hypothetical protein BYT27DRAFT_7081565 [Phlegmacium glaucopus]|nr:hypothetical protein BYT27DRAFT_7081565 [Phlegmacium glaucopus]